MESGIRINGKISDVAVGVTIEEMLRALDIDPESARGVAVAVNETVVRRQSWLDVRLSVGDEVEIVTALQGG